MLSCGAVYELTVFHLIGGPVYDIVPLRPHRLLSSIRSASLRAQPITTCCSCLCHFGSSARTRRGQGNITVAFFTDSEGATCKQNDTANAASLTTRTIPTNWVCFNLTDLFSQPSDTGSKNGSQYAQPKPYHGVDYLLRNRDSYKADGNYTNIWYQQVNITGNTKPGTDGAWVLYTYPFANCLPDGGDDYEQDEWPFFETSCQTTREGECRHVPKGVKSFAIGPAQPYNARHGHCEVWAKLGGVSVVRARTAALLVVAVAMVLLL